MGMYHKNRLAGIRSKRFAKRCTSRGRRRAVKKSCDICKGNKYTLTRKSHNIYGIDGWYFSQGILRNEGKTEEIIHAQLSDTKKN